MLNGFAKADSFTISYLMGDPSEAVEKAEKTSSFLLGLLEAARQHPIAFVFVMMMVAFVLAFLPNGPVKAYIDGRTERRKLDARMNAGKQKLIAGRQNRRK